MAEDREHARLAPSAAHRWISCPASVQFIELCGPEDTGSVYALEGTRAHRVAELLVGRELGLTSTQDALVGMQQVRLDLGSGEAADATFHEMVRHAQTYLGAIRDLIDELDQDSWDPQTRVVLEQKVDPGIPDCWGTTDCGLISPNRIAAVDFKYGAGVPVLADDNDQLKMYALGLAELYAPLMDTDNPSVCLVIVQPRVRPEPSMWCTTLDDLRQWRAEVAIPAAELALAGTDKFGPSVDTCRFCPMSGQCTAQMEAAIQRDFTNPDLMTPEVMAEALAALPAIEQWAGKVRERALSRALHDGVTIPGWKVVLSGGRRSIKDHDLAVELLVKAGFRKSSVSRTTAETLGTLEQVVGGQERLDEILGATLSKSRGRESLVPEDDPRPALTSAAADFGELPDET